MSKSFEEETLAVSELTIVASESFPRDLRAEKAEDETAEVQWCRCFSRFVPARRGLGVSFCLLPNKLSDDKKRFMRLPLWPSCAVRSSELLGSLFELPS